MSDDQTLCGEEDSRVAGLRMRLDEFYENTATYLAFERTSHHPEAWAKVHCAIEQVLRKHDFCEVLEVGAGRTGFLSSLGPLRSRVRFTAQDVTAQNSIFLREAADAVIIGDIAGLNKQFDVIFSTFVLEHVTNPRSHLEVCFDHLREEGSLFIFCPRYDIPFYISHSADHLGKSARLQLGLVIACQRIWTLLSKRPAFLVHLEPSVFHLPWAIDRDAIHWVSLYDLQAFFASRGRIRALRMPSGRGKDWIVKRWLQVSLVVTRSQ